MCHRGHTQDRRRHDQMNLRIPEHSHLEDHLDNLDEKCPLQKIQQFDQNIFDLNFQLLLHSSPLTILPEKHPLQYR